MRIFSNGFTTLHSNTKFETQAKKEYPGGSLETILPTSFLSSSNVNLMKGFEKIEEHDLRKSKEDA